jgi:hypothetical protein
MRFMVEFRLKPGMKDQAVEYFEVRGPSRNPGVTLLGAWIGKDADVVFVLIEGANESQVEAAGQAWSEFGSFERFSVVDVEQY